MLNDDLNPNVNEKLSPKEIKLSYEELLEKQLFSDLKDKNPELISQIDKTVSSAVRIADEESVFIEKIVVIDNKFYAGCVERDWPNERYILDIENESLQSVITHIEDASETFNRREDVRREAIDMLEYIGRSDLITEFNYLFEDAERISDNNHMLLSRFVLLNDKIYPVCYNKNNGSYAILDVRKAMHLPENHQHLAFTPLR